MIIILVVFCLLRCSIARAEFRKYANEQFRKCNLEICFFARGRSISIDILEPTTNMAEDNMSIENTPQLLSFMQMWMMSGGMVLSTMEGVANDNRGIELPEIPGRSFKEELERLSELLVQIVSRIE